MPSSHPPAAASDHFMGHPKGLFLLFATEMWERFSYYGMRALLVLSLVAGVEAANPGFGWSQADALRLYGLFTGFVYFTPLIGGWLADNYLGQRKSVIIGGLVMAVGQFTLSAAIPGNLSLFYVGLVILVIGNGFFKPNISTMVGDLYPEGDARRDGAFTIFYMGINAGAFLAPLICSTLGEDPTYGWRAGYFAAGVGMMLSVVIQLVLAKRYLGDIGVKPAAQRALAQSGGTKKPLTPEETDRLRVIFMLFVFVVLFWAAFEQAGGLMNIYANEKTDRFIGGFEVPAGWFQSLNPLFIVVLAPLYFFHTTGELCISPVGLSMVTKLAPLRLASLMMGVWFLINFVANWLAGIIGSYAESLGELSIFSGLAITLFLFAAILWLLSGTLVRWMHGAEDVRTA
jgi:POT family proton-dependent oligopeptide transporter